MVEWIWICAFQVFFFFFWHRIVRPLWFLPAEQLFMLASHQVQLSSKIQTTMQDTQMNPRLRATSPCLPGPAQPPGNWVSVAFVFQ